MHGILTRSVKVNDRVSLAKDDIVRCYPKGEMVEIEPYGGVWHDGQRQEYMTIPASAVKFISIGTNFKR